MEDMEYVNNLAKTADAYEAGQITRDEFRRQMAELRDRRIGSRKQKSQAWPGKPHKSPVGLCLTAAMGRYSPASGQSLIYIRDERSGFAAFH